LQQWDQNTPAKALTDHIQNVAKNKDRILDRHFENVYISPTLDGSHFAN
jgi:hypothetical protein